MKNRITLIAIALSLQLYAENSFYQYGKKVELSKVYETRTSQDKNISYYQTEFGQKVGVNNEIILQCKEKNLCMETLSKYDIIQISPLSETLFLIQISQDENIFDFSRKLYNDTNIKFAHPNFIKDRKRR